jgi:hypothetical protein
MLRNTVLALIAVALVGAGVVTTASAIGGVGGFGAGATPPDSAATLRRPAAALGKVKWFGATKRTALSSHLSDVLRNIEARRWFQDQTGEFRDGNGNNMELVRGMVTSFYL